MALKHFPVYGVMISEFFEEVVGEVQRRTGYQLTEVNGVELVNLLCHLQYDPSHSDHSSFMPSITIFFCSVLLSLAQNLGVH